MHSPKIQKLLQTIFFLIIVRPLLMLFIGINVFGRNNLISLQPDCKDEEQEQNKKTKQFIIISNHNSHLDTAAILSLFPMKQIPSIRPVAAADYFSDGSLKAWFAKTFFNILAIPRSDFTKSNNPLVIMGKALKEGESLLIFPEGSRGEPEAIADFKPGVAHLVQKFPEIPVIPIFMKGMGKSLPKGEMILIPFFCDIVIGEPVSFSGNKEEITLQLKNAVLGLQKIIVEQIEPDEGIKE